MANNEVIDGNLTVLGGLVTGGAGSILTAGSTSVTITAGTSQGASAGTVASQRGRLTTETCTAATNTIYQVVVTNSTVSINDVILATLVSGAVTTTSNYGAHIHNITMSNGSFVVNIQTLSAANAPFTIDFFVTH